MNRCGVGVWGLVGAVLLALSGSAHAGDWEKLGSRKVNFVGDKDTIAVTAAEGLFNAIKLDVDDGDLEMYNVVVTFGDGEKFSPETRFVFEQGSRSRTIDLPGAARVIRKVEFLYRSKLKKGRATLNLFGRHPDAAPAPAPAPDPAPAPPSAPLWEELGTRQVSFVVDRDTTAVTAAEGRFDAIKFEVEDGNLEMYDVVVTFGDDSKFSPETRLVFEEGSRSRTIDLPGNTRIIRKVDFLYRSKLKEGRATLKLLGRHAGAAAAPVAPVAERVWDKLGTRKVKFIAEKDTIAVTAKAGVFDAIKFEVDKGDLEMFNVVVTFGDGSKFSPETRFHFDQGTRSRWIDLPGEARIIKKVAFFYRSTLKKGHAAVTLFGHHP